VAAILAAPDLSDSGKLRAITALAEPTQAQEALDERRLEILEWAQRRKWADYPWHGVQLGGSEENWWMALYEVLKPSQILLLVEEIRQPMPDVQYILGQPPTQRLMYRVSAANHPSLEWEQDIIPQGAKVWVRYINAHEHDEPLLLRLEQAFIQQYGDCLACHQREGHE
jgi:hypothetical protein